MAVGIETAGINGNFPDEKKVSQKKEVNIKTLSDGSTGLCVLTESNKHFYFLQKVNDGKIIGGAERKNLIVSSPSPADLDNDSSLDVIESQAFSNTASGVVLMAFFYGESKVLKNPRVVISAGIKVTSTIGTATLDRLVIYIGSTAGFSFPPKEITPVISSTSSTYINTSGQAFFDDSYDISNALALKVEIYGHVDATTTRGVTKINISRGSFDSYIEG